MAAGDVPADWRVQRVAIRASFSATDEVPGIRFLDWPGPLQRCHSRPLDFVDASLSLGILPGLSHLPWVR